MFTAKQFAGTHCGCRYQQDYRPTLGKDGKKESGTLEVIKFYYDGASGWSSTATARRRPLYSASGPRGWTPTAPSTGRCPTAVRATTTRTICPKAGPRGRSGKSLLRRQPFPVEAGRRFRRRQALGLPEMEGVAGKTHRKRPEM